MIADVLARYDTQMAALVAGTRLTRGLSDTLEEDGNAWTPGATRYQIRTTYTGLDLKNDSATAHDTWSVEIVVHHHLADPGNEAAYTDGPMLDYQKSIGVDAFWLGSGVHSMINHDFSTEPKREGNVVSFGIAGLIKTNQ